MHSQAGLRRFSSPLFGTAGSSTAAFSAGRSARSTASASCWLRCYSSRSATIGYKLFLVAAALTTGVELVAGYLMEKLFHHRWWDYSAMPLNIGGYVCLPFSLLWGAACVLIEKVVHPLVVRFVAWMPHGLGAVLLIAFAALFVADIIVSVLSVIRLNRRLAELDAARQRLRLVSDALGAQLAGGALRAKGRLGLLERRLLAAFPHMRSLRHADALAALTAHQRRLHERWKALGAARSKARRSKQ